jgi:protocatechuate 3,4-dioxygenase beta subunit
MDRKEFLKRGFTSLGALSVASFFTYCKSDTIAPVSTEDLSSTGSTNGSSASDCSLTNSETEGPYPIKNPSSLVINDITGDRKGIPMVVNIAIRNKNTGCGAVENAFVDIWHCDADGNYSEYGSYTSVHWLRGRQTTDKDGLASFKTIFPGWYSGRAVHIHVHVYNSSGKSLLVTQIAFPAAICDTVYTTATDLYKKGKADTTNERDNVFGDGYSNELGTISGSIKEGFTLTHTIVVNA